MPYDKQGNWRMGPIYLPSEGETVPPKPAIDHPSYGVWEAMARKIAANPPAQQEELDKFRKGLWGEK